jgi:hypothetical protein
VPLLRDVMAAILVRFEWHGDGPWSGTGPPSYTLQTRVTPSPIAATSPAPSDRVIGAASRSYVEAVAILVRIGLGPSPTQ